MAGSKTNSDDLEDLRAQVDLIRTDISALAELMGEIGASRKDEAAQQMQDTAENLRERADAAGDQAREQFDAAAATMRTTLQDQPGMSLAIATGLGFVVGLLLARR